MAHLREQSVNGIISANGYGYYVVIDHGNGYWTKYAHMQKDGRKSGLVKRGDIIGKSSNTGKPWGGYEGVHLHFEVRNGGEWGTAVDPYGTQSWLWIGSPPKSFIDVADPPLLYRYFNWENPSDPYFDRVYEIGKDSAGNEYKRWIIHEQVFRNQWYYPTAKVYDISVNPADSLWKPIILGENIVFKDGTLIEKTSGTIFKLEKGEKRGFTSEASYFAHGYNWNTPRIKVSDTEANAIPTGLVIDYRLMRVDGTDPVYVIQGNEKKHLADIDAFNMWGLDWAKVEVVSQTELNKYAYAGELIPNRYGKFIGKATQKDQNGAPIYFISINENGETVKRHIASPTIMTYLGGAPTDIKWISDQWFDSIPTGIEYEKPYVAPIQPVLIGDMQNCPDCHISPTPTVPLPTPIPTTTPTPTQPPPASTPTLQINTDVNTDGKTDIADVTIMAQHFGEKTDIPYPPYDIKQDGEVDIFDILLVVQDIL